ncbi:N-acetylglucosamine-6-phosphate deacetylase [Planococcus lenghuensis]|uniref:N-acetylglucosamine-6-phosphate deacetylase n=1 Tax=Planococcus lenghuensis TaxID=2213202 RepID=A0A1Q2L449_9BACL|nr:N-acetylglucosamine-6-phosphate deacetylase [Planococcus lenghuensis]AQQ55235.1 N-acetylglucosamine-6-phosphate deacetylase [Planococcus lenghuensis]
MTKTMLISNVMIGDAEQESFTGNLLIEGSEITNVMESGSYDADIHIDATGKNWAAVPGFIDLHIHGAAGYDTMDATQEALRGIAQALPKEGTTSFLATTMTQRGDAIAAALKAIGRFQLTSGQAELLGVHLEGPFISAKRAGAQPIGHIIPPSLPLFEEWQTLSGDRIRLVTIAPETEGGLDFIQTMTNRGILSSIGHSDATFEDVEHAIQAGASRVTHLYNQMSPFHHRNPGVVGGALLEDGLNAELIADFVHSHQKSVELAFRQKGAEHLILITDAMRAKGLPSGTYELGGQKVNVSGNEARLADGTLAGSILTMEQAVKNVRAATGCSVRELVAMTSANAAKELGLERKGRLAAGNDADIVLLDEQFNVQLTVCRGEIAYFREVAK